MIKLKRVYEDRESDDGRRYLVERLWPRGMKKEALSMTDWLKEVAPSTELRKWFGHDPKRWAEFRRRYRKELRAQENDEGSDGLATLEEAARHGNVTLLFSSRDTEHNSAIVLKEFLEERLDGGGRG